MRLERFGSLVAATVLAVLVADAVQLLFASRAAPSDYVQDYLAARQLQAGRSVYAPAPEDAAVAPVIDPEHPRAFVNDHPPTYVLALAPLSALPYRAAFAVLGLASILATVAVGWVVGREAGLPPAGRWTVAAVLFLHPGVGCCLAVGNISLLLLGLLTAAWVAARRNAPGLGGLALGLAAAVKLFPALLIVGLLAGRRWRTATTAIGAGAVCTIATLIVLGPGDLIEYATQRAPANARLYRDHGYNLSWTAAAYRTLGEPNPAPPTIARVAVLPEWAAIVDLGGRGLIAGGLLLALWLSPRANRTPDRVFALLIPAMLLLSPITWGHALTMTVIPIAVLAQPCWRAGWGSSATLAVAAASLFAPGPGEPTIAANLLALAPTAGSLTLSGLAARWLFRPDGVTPQEAP